MPFRRWFNERRYKVQSVIGRNNKYTLLIGLLGTELEDSVLLGYLLYGFGAIISSWLCAWILAHAEILR